MCISSDLLLRRNVVKCWTVDFGIFFVFLTNDVIFFLPKFMNTYKYNFMANKKSNYIHTVCPSPVRIWRRGFNDCGKIFSIVNIWRVLLPDFRPEFMMIIGIRSSFKFTFEWTRWTTQICKIRSIVFSKFFHILEPLNLQIF